MAHKINYSIGQFNVIRPLDPGTTVVVVGNSLSTPVLPQGSLAVLLDPDIPGSTYYVARITISNQNPPNTYIRSPVGQAGYGGVFVVNAKTTVYVSVVIYSTPSESDRESYYNNGILLPSFTQVYFGQLNIINSDPATTVYDYYPGSTGGGGSGGTPIGDGTGPGGTGGSGTGSVTIDANANVIILSVPGSVTSLAGVMAASIENQTVLSGSSDNIFSTLGAVTDAKIVTKANTVQSIIASTIPRLIVLKKEVDTILMQLENIVFTKNTASEDEKLVVSAQLDAIENHLSNADAVITGGIQSTENNVNSLIPTLEEITKVFKSGLSPTTSSAVKEDPAGAAVTPLMEEVTTFVATNKLKDSSDSSSYLAKEGMTKLGSTQTAATSTKTAVNDTINTIKGPVKKIIDSIK